MAVFPEFFSENISQNQFVAEFSNDIQLFLKREDLLHPQVSGNKFRKLKYNFEAALNQSKDCILTFGGAYSNHIAATAAAGKKAGLQTIGVIRGEELGRDLEQTFRGNPTLSFSRSCGMKFLFVSRSQYREKYAIDFLEKLREKFGDFYLLPEGGTNPLAVKGCEEILKGEDRQFSHICAAVGTGGTLAGIIKASAQDQKILGFSALKGDFLYKEIQRFTRKKNWEMILSYHFGGYAKVNSELIKFINNFKKNYKIQLDPIYTGKLVFGIFDLIKRGYFPRGSRILAVHTGGLQGIEGMNRILTNKNLPLIKC